MENRWCENMRDIRKEKGITQVELAENLSVTQSYISQIERGYIDNPTIKTLMQIADALDADILEFFAIRG